MALPLAIIAAVLFWGLTGADVVSYAVTGNDSIYNLASMLGWVGTTQSDNIIFQWGMSFMDFLIADWLYICLFFALVFTTIWLMMRPMKPRKVKA